jgi:hypothetical protein
MIEVPYLRIAANLDEHKPVFIEAVTGSKTVSGALTLPLRTPFLCVRVTEKMCLST